MSEQEKKSGVTASGGSSSVKVEQTAGSRHKQTYRPNEMQEPASELNHKRSRAPEVSSVAENIKNISEHTNARDNADKERTEHDRGLPTENKKSIVSKTPSSTASANKRREHSPETFTVVPLGVETKIEMTTLPSHIIPSQVIEKGTEKHKKAEELEENRVDENSITEEIAELRTPEAANKQSKWSDEEEAGGLPRSDSRSSRVSRTIRQLFCCGVPYEAPSEDDVSIERGYAYAI